MGPVLNTYPILSWILSFQGFLIFPKGLFSVVQEAAFPPFITGILIHSLGCCVLQPERCFVSHYHTHLSVPPALGSYGFVQGCFFPILPPFASSCFVQGASPSFCTSIFGCIFLHQGFHWCLYVENVQINMFMYVYYGHYHLPYLCHH